MGLSVHYHGEIKNMDLIPELTEEVKNICEVFGWTFHLFDDKDFQGICFNPPEGEPVFLTFNNTPHIASPVLWQLKMETAPVSVKTQFAGIEAHIALIKLLKYLSNRYFKIFELSDEGNYWETGDAEVLKKQFAAYNYALDTICNALKDLKPIPGETASSLADRLEQFFRDLGKTDPDTEKFT